MGNELLFFKKATLFIGLNFFLIGNIYAQEDNPKELYLNAINSMQYYHNYKEAINNFKKLIEKDYCNTDALELLQSYALTMDNKRPSARRFIQQVDRSAFSDKIQEFCNTLETFINGEGPNLSASQYQSLLDYLNPPLPGESNRLLDRQKEQFLVRREYIKRYFESSSNNGVLDQLTELFNNCE